MKNKTIKQLCQAKKSKIKTIRQKEARKRFSGILDKYYSYQSIFELFDENTRVIVVPKKNATIKGPKRWKQLLQDFITSPLSFLKSYYRREKTEANAEVRTEIAQLCDAIIEI